MISGIYEIKNIITNKIYIGSSKDINKRWKIHIYLLEKNKHNNIHLQRSWNKYNKENFIFEIIEECNCNLLLEKEQYYLDNMKNLYNIGKNSSGGDNLTNHPNRKNIINKIIIGIKNRYNNFSEEEWIELSNRNKGDKNPNFNNKWNDESKENMKLKMIEYYKNNIPFMKGKTYEELYDCDKAKKLRDNLSKCASEKIGEKNPFYNRHHTEETKKKLSENQLGKYNGQQNIPFIINGIDYDSLGKASKELNIPMTTIRWRIKSKNPKYINYYYKN